jgi:hypothetical protein
MLLVMLALLLVIDAFVVACVVAIAFVTFVAASAAIVAAPTIDATNAYDACDVYELKTEWRFQKTRLFTDLNKDRQVHTRGHKVISWEQLMPCFKPAWDKGFTRERNLKRWRMDGHIPFNRNDL